MPSVAVALDGDILESLRQHDPPVIARTRDGRTLLDLRSVDPADDEIVVAALRSVSAPAT
jgi:L-seryl-tRNA(Ser) seleniumtransferase